MTRRRLAMGWIALQLLFLAGWARTEHSRLEPGQGRSILVRAVRGTPDNGPDGGCLRLEYEFSRQVPDNALDGQEVWAMLAPEGRFHVPVRTTPLSPLDLTDDEVAMRGHVDGGRCLFGIERYFVPETSGPPGPGELTVRLRVGEGGRSRIEQVYVEGAPWP